MDETHVLILVIGLFLLLVLVGTVWTKLSRDTSPALGPTQREHAAQPVLLIGYGESVRATWHWLRFLGLPINPFTRMLSERVLDWLEDEESPPPADIPLGPQDPFETIPLRRTDDIPT